MNNKLAILSVVAIVTAFAASTFVIGLGANDAFAARQSCNQPGDLIAACVNANVEKNNICVGVLADSSRCTTN
jgi:hypothetical protein